jgi:hypothetical protein
MWPPAIKVVWFGYILSCLSVHLFVSQSGKLPAKVPASMGVGRRQLPVYRNGMYVNCGGSGLQDILKNKKIIAVNQDPLGIQGRRIYKQKGETFLCI